MRTDLPKLLGRSFRSLAQGSEDFDISYLGSLCACGSCAGAEFQKFGHLSLSSGNLEIWKSRALGLKIWKFKDFLAVCQRRRPNIAAVDPGGASIYIYMYI